MEEVICWGLLGFTALFIVSAVVYKLSVRKFVLRTSIPILELERLNRETRRVLSDNYDRVFHVTLAYKTKQQYDARSLYHGFAEHISSHRDRYFPLYCDAKADLGRYEQYTVGYHTIRGGLAQSWQPSFQVGRGVYERIEKRAFAKMAIKPPQTRFHVRKSYTSPKGRAHYEEKDVLRLESFLNICEPILQRDRKQSQATRERKRLTRELRYKILLRDGFRCQICGRDISHGVVLHVDHIRPVSKGGKTEAGNLRTLCEDCNLGKSDYYAPNGLN